MRVNRLLRLINRAQIDLDEARKEAEVNPLGSGDDDVSEEIREVRSRLDALEVRVSVIEEGQK